LPQRDYCGNSAAVFAEKVLIPCPLIPTVRSGARPFWSVMIPTYNPRADYLEETLHSVLHQDPGPEQMQIEVVDDGSADNAASDVVRRVGAGRVAFHAERQNRGLANTWDLCIERARGNWVHILHQDDIVLPGFYEHLYRGIVCNPHIGMAFCRFAIIDANGHWKELGPLESATAGVLNNWLERVATGYHLECPAVVVKRATYERLGVSARNSRLPSILKCGSGLPLMRLSTMSRRFWPASGDMATINLQFNSVRVQICKTWLEQLRCGEIICRQIPGCSWNSKGVAIGPGSHLCSLNIFSPMMMLPRVQVSCALLKHCGTTAGIVRVGYGWKRKCFSTAHSGNVPYL
jgi:hypothetical protein